MRRELEVSILEADGSSRDLSNDGWTHCVAIRRQVFVVGQDCPEDEEFDEHDRAARHLLVRREGRPVATARWRVVQIEHRPEAKLERFAVLEEARGLGLGRLLVARLLDDARARGCERFRLHAQSHLCGFYASFGFRVVGDAFDEAGIEHRLMVAGLDDLRLDDLRLDDQRLDGEAARSG